MTLLLAKYHDVTYFAIIGFVLGSIFVLFFNFDIFNYYRVWANPDLSDLLKIHQLLPMWIEMIIGLAVLVGCAFLSYLLVIAQRKHALKEKESNNEELPQG